MRLSHLAVHNYKSLRNISFSPTPLTVLVGPNAAGKTNFADSIHFLAEVYTHGLELAVARKGGFENIAFRKQRRTKAPIAFDLTIKASGSQLRRFRKIPGIGKSSVQLSHRFSIAASGTGIRAEFKVAEEEFVISFGGAPDTTEESTLSVIRKAGGKLVLQSKHAGPLARAVLNDLEMYRDLFKEQPVPDQELFVHALPFRHVLFSAFVDASSKFEVYQISPAGSRSPGVPTPNPSLATSGENLPALVDWLQREHPKLWNEVMDGMIDILPGLTEISVQYLHTKTLGIFFNEGGSGRAWGTDDVSDGTIQSLALLVASVDPRSTLLVVEEPENSVHPWIIRVLVDRFRAVSKAKDVILTTHSPVLIDLLKPEELWIVSKHDGATEMRRIADIEPVVAEDWKSGSFRLSEFLDAGFIPQAVPGGVE